MPVRGTCSRCGECCIVPIRTVRGRQHFMLNKSGTQCKYLIILDDGIAVCRIREGLENIPTRDYDFYKKACTIFPNNKLDFKGLTKCTHYWEDSKEELEDDS